VSGSKAAEVFWTRVAALLSRAVPALDSILQSSAQDQGRTQQPDDLRPGFD